MVTFQLKGTGSWWNTLQPHSVSNKFSSNEKNTLFPNFTVALIAVFGAYRESFLT